MAPSLINLLSPYSIIIYMLVFSRLNGLFQSAPFFSTMRMPMMTKIWFCALIAFIFYPMVKVSKFYILPSGMPELFILLVMEFLIGYLIGFVANLLFEGVRMSGNILSIQMGISMSEALDPATGVQAAEVSMLYLYLATLIFLASGAYQYILISIYNSFSSLPMGSFILFNDNMISALITLFGQIFKIAFGVAFPIFSVLLITDILLGVTSKMMPQMNIYMVAIPVKIYIGLFLIFAFLSAETTYLHSLVNHYMDAIRQLFI